MVQHDPFDLERFVTAQDAHGTFLSAIAELRRGRKANHWMWFVFPQLRGLGRSEMAERFGIASLEEARAYLAHPVLGPRLQQCMEVAMAAKGSATEVFGPVDAIKLRSSLTLFMRAAPEKPLFRDALQRFFNGEADGATDRLLAWMGL